jgi:hypothetical protein
MRKRRSNFATQLQKNPLTSSGCTGCLPADDLAVPLGREASDEETGRTRRIPGRQAPSRARGAAEEAGRRSRR